MKMFTKKLIFTLTSILLFGNIFTAQTWDILDKSMAAWNVAGGSNNNKAWTATKKGSGITTTQESGYVNIKKINSAATDNYAFLTPPALTLSINTAYSIEIKARVNDKVAPDTDSYFESNQISARLNQKNLSIHLKYGDANSGYVSVSAAKSHDDADKYKINTSEWHIYRFVFYADNSMYDVYIDNIVEPIFENIPTTSMTGSNIIRLGAESQHRCNMDIEYVKMGTGDFYSKPKIVSVVLSSDSHVENNARTITVTTNTVLIDDNEKLYISLVNDAGNTVVSEIEAVVSSNSAQASFSIPASISKGKYFIKAAVQGNQIGTNIINPKTAQYVIVEPSPITSNLLPNVSPVGFIIGINDYTYQAPSKEFIFPAIIDTKPYTQNGKFLNGETPLDRYYRYYTPHENPGGMFLVTGPTLDGPWTERNTVMDLAWAQAVPNNVINTASHISACQVVWNEHQNKYFMYFHGPNTTTHYATSDNLVDWTFGASILTAQSFGSRGAEASYAKVFEHKLPNIDNKYILMLMIAESSTSRKIYWAHSKDGIDWTCSRTPLISADLDYKKIPGTDIKPNYVGGIGNNVAGPFFMRSDNRNFVFFNGSSGHICVAEIGENFDMEVHWGEYMKAEDVIIDTDNSGAPVAVPRIAAPVFIQNDEGKWYMFFEAGGRLGANIALAKEKGSETSIQKDVASEYISISSNMLNVGQAFSITVADNISLSEVRLYGITGNTLYQQTVSGNTYSFNVPASTGLYVLSVKLNNNISKEFKVLVK